MAAEVPEAFIKGALAFSLAVTVFLAGFITVYAPAGSDDPTIQDAADDLTATYEDWTGSSPMSEEIWGLTGIYTPYDGSHTYGYTSDGWLYGSRIASYSPSQLGAIDESYTVRYDDAAGLYYYYTQNEKGDWVRGDLYDAVCMDVTQRSTIFWTAGDKTAMDNGTFYYQYTGYRYAFQPLDDYTAGNGADVHAKNTSLSLIWYYYYTDSGIAGQLVLSGSDSGVEYITANQIVYSLNAANQTAKFDMVFNGLDVHVYLRLNPYAITSGYTPEAAYNAGLWSILITTDSTAGSTTGSYSFDLNSVWDTIVGLLTFNLDDYGLSGEAALIASLAFSASLYTSLIAVAMRNKAALVLAAILAVIQTWSFI